MHCEWRSLDVLVALYEVFKPSSERAMQQPNVSTTTDTPHKPFLRAHLEYVVCEPDFVPVATAMLNGLFEVKDRGDGIADITLIGDFGEITAACNEAAAEWDACLGRPALPLPVGFKIERSRVGSVHADHERVLPCQDESGHWVRLASALPGLARIRGAKAIRVESQHELEKCIAENKEMVTQHAATRRRWGEPPRHECTTVPALCCDP